MFRSTFLAILRGARRVNTMRHPLDPDVIGTALARLPRREVVLVHSSLSACGYVSGGAATVIRALQAWCGKGTLAMPTHTYCYPDVTGAVAVFDFRSSASAVGTITDLFWRQPGVLRSLHPTHSLAAHGPLAATLTSGHDNCLTPCGAGTPYERLVQWDAGILMFGTTMETYTLFHTAEDAASVPYLYEAKPYALKILALNGRPQDFIMRRQNMSISRSFRSKDKWLEARGLLQRMALGRGELLYVSSATLAHRALLDALSVDPMFLLTQKTR